MRQSYYTKPSGSMGFANTGFSQRGSRQTQVYIAILLGRAVGGAISNRLLGANSPRVRLQRTALSYIPQILHAVRIRRSPFGVLSGVAQNRFIKYVYFSTSKFGVVAASQIGISRLVWFTLLRLIRTQKLNLLQKKTLSSEYDLHLRNFFNKLRKLEGFRNWVVSESSNIHFILNKTYRWLHHAFRFFQKHKRNVQSVLNYRTVRMGRCFLTPFLMRKFSRIQTVRKMMTFSFREWKRYYRNMKNILSRASIRSVLWNSVGRRGLSKLGTYVRNSQMLKLTVPKSTVEALNFSMEAYNPLIKPNSGRPLSNTVSQNANSIRLKNFLSTDSSKVYTNMGVRKSISLEPDMSSSFSQKSKINPPYLFRATGPSRACKQPPLLKVRTESWCGLKPFDRGGNLKRFGGFRSTLSEFVKRNQLPKAAKLPLGKLLDGQRYVTNRNFGADVAVGYRLSLLSYRKTITNRRLSTLLSLAGGIATPSNLEIRLMVMEMLSFILSSDKRVLLANQIALRILPKTSQLSYTSHTDIVGAKIANKNKVKVFRQRFFKRRLLRFFKKWKFVSRILQVRTLLFKPHWVMRKINRKSKTPLSFSSYTWMVKFFGYRYLFKINGRYRRMLFNSKKRKAKRKNATNPRGPQHLKFKYGNRIKNITRRGQMKKLFLRLSKRGRRRFLSNIRNQSAARSASTAIRSRSRFLSVRYVSLLGRSNGVLVGAIKNIVLRSTSLPKKFVTIRTTTPSCGGVSILKPKPLLHWQLPLMEQVRIRNKEREERLRVRAAILDRIRLKSQESTDFKKLQEEGLAKVMSNPSINTYRNMKILKYAYSGRPNLLKLISLLGVYRRQKKREAEIKYRSAQKLKRERFKFFKKSKNRQNIRTLSVKTRRRKVNVGLCVSATSPFAGNTMWLDDIRISSSPATKFIPLSSSKKFHKISTHLKIVGSYRLYNLIQRRMRTKEKNLTILRRYRRTGEKRSRPRIVWVVGGSSEDKVENNRKPSNRVLRRAGRGSNFRQAALWKVLSGTRFLYHSRHFRYRRYLCFLEQSSLFQHISRYCIYKMGLIRGMWQKIVPVSGKLSSVFGLRRRCRPYRPFGVRLNQFTPYASTAIGRARARQKLKIKKAIFYTNNKVSVHHLWESMTRIYPSFGYFRKLRLEKRRERLMLKNRTKPLRFEIFNKNLGAYWGPRALKVRTLVLRKMRANLETDNISQCVFWKKAIQFFYTSRFLKGFKQKRIRVPQGLPYLMVSKLMPNIKRLRSILKEEIKIMKLKRVKLFPKFMYARKRMKVFKETPYKYRVPNFRFASLRFLQNGKRRLPPYWHRTRKKKFPLKSQKKDWTKSMGFWYSMVRSRREAVTYLEGSVSYRPGKYSIALTRVLERFNLERELSLMLRFRKNKPLIFLPYVHYVQWWRYQRDKFEAVHRRHMHLYGLKGRGSKKIWFGKSKVNKSTVKGLKYFSRILEVQNRSIIRGRMAELNSTMTSYSIIMGKFYSRLQNLNDYSSTLGEVRISTRSPDQLSRSKNALGRFRYNVALNRTVFYDKISLFHFTNSVFRLYVDLFASANRLLSQYPDKKKDPNLFGRRLVLSLLNYSMYSKNSYFTSYAGGVSEKSLKSTYVRFSKNLSVTKRLNRSLLFSRLPTSRLNLLNIRYKVPSRKNILVKYMRGFLVSKTVFRNVMGVW